ncbi:MAG: DUF4159 domain-containing protein, partial [Proteobacteria bacterium]|nr:DUF4159 domain-containing protein [Pseudomonadota bacterium]
LIGVEVLQSAKTPPKPKVRKPAIKPVQKPEVPVKNTVIVEPVKMQTRATNAAVVRTATVQLRNVSAFSNQALKLNAPVNSNVPKVVSRHAPMSQVVTHTDVPVSGAPDALAFFSPPITGIGKNGGHVGHGIGGDRGISEGAVQVRIANVFKLPAALTMVKEVGAVRDALDEVVDNIMLGNLEVSPLPRGEPGGRIVGKGRDIRGILRFTRVRHSLSDWWADPSSLNAWTKWMNARTKIKTDMNVAGGALKFTDANLHKAPLLFMTGHDPALARSVMSREPGSGKLDHRLSEPEAVALRRYLVERGGLLCFDDCGTNAPAQAMIRRFLAQMRFVMPEYHVTRIPNDHEIYSIFYKMGGPPTGFDLWWSGAIPPGGNHIEGIFIGDKISVLVIRRDYMCAMESISVPSRPTQYSPSVYRFMTNVAIYALTRGKISDYSGYVPEDKLGHQRFPSRAPQAAMIGAVE